MYRDSSTAFKELSLTTFEWIKDTHHSVQEQEVRLEQIEQDTQDQGREIYANSTDLYCIQANYELHEARLEQLERIVHGHKNSLLFQERKLGEIEEGNKKTGKELQAQDKRVEGRSKAVPQEAPVQATEGAWPLSPGILSTTGSNWPGSPAGVSSTPTARLTSRIRGQEKRKESI